MTDWTPPTHVVAGTEIDASKHNDEVVDNLKHLHEAKVCRLGRLAALDISDSSWTPIPWDYEVHDTMGAWASTPYAERIYPNPAGFYRVSAAFTFPLSASGGIGSIRLRLWQDSTLYTVTQSTSVLSTTRSTTRNLSAIVELDGVGDYVFAEVYQDSGGLLTSAASAPHSFDLEWIGA